MEPSARLVADSLGMELQLGQPLAAANQRRLADALASHLFEAIGERGQCKCGRSIKCVIDDQIRAHDVAGRRVARHGDPERPTHFLTKQPKFGQYVGRLQAVLDARQSMASRCPSDIFIVQRRTRVHGAWSNAAQIDQEYVKQLWNIIRHRAFGPIEVERLSFCGFQPVIQDLFPVGCKCICRPFEVATMREVPHSSGHVSKGL